MTASTDEDGERDAIGEAELLPGTAGRSTTARVTEGELRRLAVFCLFVCARVERGKKGGGKRR